MIYCKLRKKQKDSALYDIGATVNDITGQALFYSDGKNPQVIKQPEKYAVRDAALVRVAVKYKKKLADEKFPEKMSVEIG